jgi:UDP-glucose 4-epimerase
VVTRQELTPVTWVLGARGLVGRAIVSSSALAFSGGEIRWEDDANVIDDFALEALRFSQFAGERPWRIFWAAGVGVISSPVEVIKRDAWVLERFLEVLDTRLPSGNGVITLVSSAGGVYAGSVGAPFDEQAVPVPISAYGEGKLAQEAAIDAWCRANAISASIARFANVYGTGQNLGKPQGLISHACAAAVRGEPIRIFVPLETRRHYVYEADAGLLVTKLADIVAGLSGAQTIVKNIAGGPPVPISRILALIEQVNGTELRIIEQAAPDQAFHPVDVLLASDVTPELDQIPLTSIEEGVVTVFRALRGLA